jgi:hypothetical protein
MALRSIGDVTAKKVAIPLEKRGASFKFLKIKHFLPLLGLVRLCRNDTHDHSLLFCSDIIDERMTAAPFE